MSAAAGRPRVTLKLATSLDGRIALADGQSKWITGPEARAEVHRLRASHDAVLTGIGTVLADDPQMTARPDDAPAARQPVRAVLDTRLRIPPGARMLKAAGVMIFHVSGDAEAVERLEAVGAQCVRIGADAEGRASIPAALTALADRGCGSVMIEAGGTVAGAAIAASCLDRLEWFRAPRIVGGDGRACISALGLERLDAAPMFRRTGVRALGADLWERYQRIEA